MTTADRVLAVLGLFSLERPEWTVEAIVAELGLSGSTAYQYVRSLAQAGLLVANKPGRYTIGPAALELDRIARHVDPLVHQARAVLEELVDACALPAIGLLCRLYRRQVMCVDQYVPHPPGLDSSYERGRPMPQTRGSASRVILANLPPRALRRFYESAAEEVAAAGLGGDWEEFRRGTQEVRRAGILTAVGELDPGALGISAPVFGNDASILGSISLVISAAPMAGDAALVTHLERCVRAAGTTVSEALRRN